MAGLTSKSGRLRFPDLAGILAFAICLSVVTLLGVNRKAVWLNEYKIAIQGRLNATGINLATGIGRRESLLASIVALAELHLGTGTLVEEFKSYATGFHANDPVIRAIEIYPPQGKVLVYPIEGNQAVLRLTLADVLSDMRPLVRMDVERTVLTRKPTLSNPYLLLQGLVGVVAQQAIYQGDKFWGLGAIVLDLDALLDAAGFGKGNPDLQFALTDSSGAFFRGERFVLHSDPVHYTIPLSEGFWTLSAVPVKGWSAGLGSRLFMLWLAGFLFSLLLAIVIRSVSKQHNAMAEKISDQDRDLEENRQRLQIAVEASNIGFFDYDIYSGKVIRSPEYERQLGFESGEMPPGNSYWEKNLHPEDREAALNASIECIEGRKSEFEVEYRLRHRDGSWRWILGRGKTLTDPAGKVLHLLGCHVDIAKRKMAEQKAAEAHAELRRLLNEADRSRMALLSLIEDQKAAEKEIKKLNAGLEERVRDRTAQLEAANKELEAFSYSVSHDLRAPLRSMNGFATALAEKHSADLGENGMHYLDRIRESTLRMGQLINDLLGLSRVTRTALTRTCVDLSALAEKIAAGFRAENPERKVSFDIASGLVVEADPHLLEIMMENLLGNAWKYSGKKEKALIQVGSEVSASGETVYFVRDNGVGFDMAHTGKLFTPFQRLHGMAEFPGTGIGLATVHRIVMRHGGRIWPEAEPGKGATFYFTLEDRRNC